MNKAVKIAFIIVTSLLVSAVIILMIDMFSKNASEETPQFVYTTASTTQSTASATQGTTASTTQSTAVSTSSQPQEQKPVQAEEIVLLTSNDPENYFELTFGEDTIYIKGRYSADHIDFISAGGASRVMPVYADDGSFTAEIKPYLIDLYGNLDIDGMKWRIRKRGDGARFVICDDVMEQNSSAKEHILDIPEDIVADYIVTGGTSKQRTEVLAEISDIAAQVCEGMESDYDKARALSQWVSQNIYYDFDAYDSSVTTETLSLSGTLSLHRSVCGGYANLYAALCQSQGIDCYIVQGAVVQSQRTFDEADEAPSHEWNLVHIDGRYFWVDTLWNNSDNIYADGEYSSNGSPNLRYFDPTEEAMAQNHRAVRVERREFYMD